MHRSHENQGTQGAYSQNRDAGQPYQTDPQAGGVTGVQQVDGFGSSHPQGEFAETGRWSGNADDVGRAPYTGTDAGTQPIGSGAHGGQGDAYGGRIHHTDAGLQSMGPGEYAAQGREGAGQADTYGAGRQGGTAHTGIAGGARDLHSDFTSPAGGDGGRRGDRFESGGGDPLNTTHGRGGEGNIDSANDGFSRSGNSTGASAGGKLLGSVEKVAGKITGNAGMVERGEERKLGITSQQDGNHDVGRERGI